jgi:hypothetical protein
MLTTGLKESTSSEIHIDNMSYPVFSSIMNYLYSGEFCFGAETEGQETTLDCLFEFMRVADEYLLQDVKLKCENYLIDNLNQDNFQQVSEMAEMYNAERLIDYCNWYKRKNPNLTT